MTKTRNLFQYFSDCRKSAGSFRPKRGFDSSAALLGPDEHSVGSDLASTLPPRWIDDIDRMRDNIRRTSGKFVELETVQKARLSIDFDDVNEKATEEKIERLMMEVTTLMNGTKTTLKSFSSSTKTNPNLTPTEMKIRGNIERVLARRLSDLSQQFFTQQEKYVEALKRQSSEDVGSHLAASIEQGVKATSSAQPTSIGGGFTLVQEQHTGSILDSRFNEIENIAKSSLELQGMMNDVQTLVVEQGTMLDQIDYNLEVAVTQTAKGMKELEKAESYQKKARPFKIMIVQIIIIIILCGVLVSQK
eukprot:TRINITY_DN780219_c0_g1_i1.p1 TRINITY_DN780219_c0_g1~~TRINITY_DN780219_c0_g1_i1.p1  ORF type:complete len:314 (-),score=63.39 TRINITY_DN780219_c0_g1_i1:240-1151(-)